MPGPPWNDPRLALFAGRRRLVGIARSTTDAATPGNRPDRAVGDAPAAIGAVRVHDEPVGSEFEGVRRTDRRTEPAEHANVGIDGDHFVPPARGEGTALARFGPTLANDEPGNRTLTRRGGESRGATPGPAPQTP